MSPLSALTQAWTAAGAALPLGWQVSGRYCFGDLWIGLAEGPAFDDYASGSGRWRTRFRAPGRLHRPILAGSAAVNVAAANAERTGGRASIVLSEARYWGPNPTADN